MSRLFISFCLALVSHIYLLQFHFSVNDSSAPQLISDSSVFVTLDQRQDKQPVIPTQLSSQSEQKPKQEENGINSQPPAPQPVPKIVSSSQRAASILPKAHKIKKEIEPQLKPEQLCEARAIVEKIKLQESAEPTPQSPPITKKHNTTPELAPPAGSALRPTKLAAKRATSSVVKARPMYQHSPKPEYPNIARRRGWEGIVKLEVEVTWEGKISTVRLLKSCGYNILDKSALRAVKNWRFLAGTAGGRPATTRVIIPIHFILQK
ncbi:MAG: energy transducer TonB [Desulfobulbaceae bacterium]|nr:energy transducer TonB [Desulfobulbaceae bacterium]